MTGRCLVVLAVSATIGLAGCGGSTVTSVITKGVAGSTGTHSTSTSVPAAATGNAIPQYKPSTVTVSKHIGGASKTELTSTSSTGKVAAFYEHALRSGGWQVEKTTRSGDTIEYKAIKGAAAAKVEISSAGAGASITVKVIQ